MTNIIYCFSGTGNSLAVARDIANKLGDTKVVAITERTGQTEPASSYECVGFVFPSYYACVPGIVKRFIGKLDFSKQQYVFGAVVYGGSYGMTLSQLGLCIRDRGGVLNAGFSVRMPGNYIDKYGALPGALQKFMFSREKKKTDKIALSVRNKIQKKIPKGSFLIRLSANSSNKVIASFGENARNFHTDEKCNGCGICQRVCPVGNIKLVEKRPQWGDTCEHCVACIQWCPVHAVQYADKTQNRKHYHNPGIKVSDMM